MAAEAPLQTLYSDPAEREHWARSFLAQLKAAKLSSYVSAPEEVALPALERSMALLVSCLVERQPDRYVAAQRELFAQRVRQGVAVADLLAGLEAAQDTLDGMIRKAYADAPASLPAMLQRGQRYLLMARTTLVSLMADKPKAAG